ncbi:MAG: hypothetical protein CL582_00760, partial [Alteromonadaceae bacterium]|nr:hypothetical protein [Alteromonadaceae bacterium]
MKLADFFKNAVKAGRLKQKGWIIAAFSVTKSNEENPVIQPWDIYYSENDSGQLQITFVGEDSMPVDIDDYEFSPEELNPPYRFREKLTIDKSIMPNIEGDKLKTTYGNVIANWLLCVYPFGDKIPYFEGKFKVTQVEGYIEKLLTTDDGGERDPSKIYIDEYNKFRRAAGLLDGLSQLCVPSATRKTLTRHPDAEKLRAELLEKYKDKLHDPATVAKIDEALVNLDKEWLKGDRSEGFFIKAKSLNVVRKKAHYSMGLDQSFSESSETDFIPGSLSDGWDIDKLPTMASSLREGSFDRGAQTALGGEAVKFILRVMQNALVEGEDCGSKIGVKTQVTEANKKQMLGNNIISGGSVVKITEENVDKYVGKTVNMRTPLFC